MNMPDIKELPLWTTQTQDGAEETIKALRTEIYSARRKFPGRRFLLTALVEEVGELAAAILKREGPARIRKEAIQVACVAIRIFEEMDPVYDSLTDDEAKP
jgi:NTP pyrophosphatase (non-canonical NTP hydrolase)